MTGKKEGGCESAERKVIPAAEVDVLQGNGIAYCISSAVLPWAPYAGKGEAGVEFLTGSFLDQLSLLSLGEVAGGPWDELGVKAYQVYPLAGSHQPSLIVLRSGKHCGALGWQRQIHPWGPVELEVPEHAGGCVLLPGGEIERRLEVVARWNAFWAKAEQRGMSRHRRRRIVEALVQLLAVGNVGLPVRFIESCGELSGGAREDKVGAPPWCDRVVPYKVDEGEGLWMFEFTTWSPARMSAVETWRIAMTEKGLVSVHWELLGVFPEEKEDSRQDHS